ncbi:hypothetical protein SEPCBS119000_001791 [Sporothrix epigloea]|uniref:Uncharacterized protein n=1 Tax=Sporothrix epigloea TaxID=1892477 RepID=A0ABP0DCW7_9PEZI
MDRTLVHKKAARIAPASDIRAEGNRNSQGKAAPSNGQATATATGNSNGDASHTPKKRRKVNHGIAGRFEILEYGLLK